LLQQELKTLQASITTLTNNNTTQEKKHTEQIKQIQAISIPRAHLLPELDWVVSMLRLCVADVKEQRALAHVIIATHHQAEEDIKTARHETATLTNTHASEMQTLHAQLTTAQAALLENTAATAHAAAATSAMAQSCDRFKAGKQRLQEIQINAREYAKTAGVLASGLGAWLTGTICRTTVEKSPPPGGGGLFHSLIVKKSALHCSDSAERGERDDDEEKEEKIICNP
jgi:hypothetical protein